MATPSSYSAFNLAWSSLCRAPGQQEQCYILLKKDAKAQMFCAYSGDRACTTWPWRNTAVLAAVFRASLGKQTLSFLFSILFLPCSVELFTKASLHALPGASAARERSPAEDGVRWREGRSHRVPWARSDAVLERAANVLRRVSGADHHRDGQAEVLRHGPRSDHVDGLDHLSDRDRREAQVSTIPSTYANGTLHSSLNICSPHALFKIKLVYFLLKKCTYEISFCFLWFIIITCDSEHSWAWWKSSVSSGSVWFLQGRVLSRGADELSPES